MARHCSDEALEYFKRHYRVTLEDRFVIRTRGGELGNPVASSGTVHGIYKFAQDAYVQHKLREAE